MAGGAGREVGDADERLGLGRVEARGRGCCCVAADGGGTDEEVCRGGRYSATGNPGSHGYRQMRSNRTAYEKGVRAFQSIYKW